MIIFFAFPGVSQSVTCDLKDTPKAQKRIPGTSLIKKKKCSEGLVQMSFILESVSPFYLAGCSWSKMLLLGNSLVIVSDTASILSWCHYCTCATDEVHTWVQGFNVFFYFNLNLYMLLHCSVSCSDHFYTGLLQFNDYCVNIYSSCLEALKWSYSNCGN